MEHHRNALRERAANAQTPPRPAGCLDLSPRGGDNVLDDREPQTRAARRSRAVAPVEPLEQAGQIVLLDTAPVVVRLEDAVSHKERQRRTRARIVDRIL